MSTFIPVLLSSLLALAAGIVHLTVDPVTWLLPLAALVMVGQAALVLHLDLERKRLTVEVAMAKLEARVAGTFGPKGNMK